MKCFVCTGEKYKIETKGLVLIVNQVHYPSELMGSPRKGSEVDCNRLTEVFCSLGYRPVTLVDLTAQVRFHESQLPFCPGPLMRYRQDSCFLPRPVCFLLKIRSKE